MPKGETRAAFGERIGEMHRRIMQPEPRRTHEQVMRDIRDYLAAPSPPRGP